MFMVSSRPASFSALVFAVVFLSGCQATKVVYQPSTVNPSYTLQGNVIGGEQPIGAATIQLYAVNTATTGGASTPLLSATVTTSDGSGVANANANAGNDNNQLAIGLFTISASDFECPSGDSLLYIAASGGNPGAGTNNVQENVAGLGACDSLPARVTINEITTVGTVRALSSYMTAYNAVGAASAQAAGLATAFNAINEYVQIEGGSAPGPALPAGYDASSNDLRALANDVQSCVDTNGATGVGSICGTLFTDARGTAASVPGDTVTALLDIFADPTNNVGTIFHLQGSQPAFAPTNAYAPPDWTLPILEIPSTPVISPAANTYASAQTVTIGDADTDATDAIYYTTDGSTPSATNGTLYSGAITVSSSETVQAIAIDDSRLSSAVASAAYTINSSLTAPTVSLAAITAPYGSTTGVTLTATSNAAGSVVTFGTAGSVGGSFSPTTCTIATTTCSVSYIPSGTLAVGAYANDLTASFAAYGAYAGGYATSTLTVNSTPSTTLMFSFTGTAGSYPGQLPEYGNLIQGSDGNFYGMTFEGGTNSDGVIFKVSSAGAGYTVLHNFAGGTTDGKNPIGSLVEGSDGNFYGMTEAGGVHSDGTVFQITSSGTFALLHSFAGGTSDGEAPYDNLVEGSDGNFYGMARAGGASGFGAVFKITSTGTFTLLHGFAGGTSDGEFPIGSLVQGSDGNFYGMTYEGGVNNYGTVFKISPSSPYTVTLLHSFAGGTSDGEVPYGSLVEGSDGNFYGMTPGGGSSSDGTVFQISPSSPYTVTLLHSFAGGTSDGKVPYGSLVEGSDGNFYGMATGGGSSNDGTIFQISPSSPYPLTLLHSFAGGTSDGKNPYGSLVEGSDGNFYGMTSADGSSSDGTIVKIAASPALAAPVTLSVPSSVNAGENFTMSYAVSNAYSTTLESCEYYATNSSGTVVASGALTGSPTTQMADLTAPATAGTYTYALTCGGVESSLASVTVGAATPAETPDFSPGTGTYSGAQTVYIYSDTGTSIYYTTDGNTPVVGNGDTTLYSGPIVVSASETVEAIATGGGYSTSGVGSAVYTINALVAPTVGLSAVSSSSGSTTPVTITATGNDEGAVVTFGVTGTADGSFSPATCVIASGTCSVSYVPSGTLGVGTYTNDLTASFAATGSYAAANATSTLTIKVVTTFGFSTLYNFGTHSSDGYGADSTLILASDGNFYGTTYSGGSGAYGTIFKVTPGGVYTTLYNFTNGSDGGYPYAGVIQGRDGNLYGTTTEGGASQSQGTIFEYVLGGATPGLTTLYQFTGGADGGEATGGVIQGADGNFYGVGEDGGGPNQGTIFEYVPGTGLTTLYTFTSSVGGLAAGRLLQGADGNFYGTTLSGGSSGEGIVFQLVPNGASSTLTTLYAFTGGTDGASPDSGVTQGADGNFYGTTSAGGSSYGGTLFELVPNGASSTLTTLYNFTNGSDGTDPEGNLLLGSDGNFYGTSHGRPGMPPFFPSTYGAVFELVPAGASSQFSVVHPFTGGSGGGNAAGGLVQGAQGNFYGTATAGGANSEGVIYEETASPALAGPVALTVPGSVAAGAGFTLSYAVSNATSETMRQCFATNTGGDTTGWTGVKTAAVAATNAMLTAPAGGGTYSYTLTCGGMESGFATLHVSGPPAAPTFSPVAGTYSSAQSVTISDTDTNAAIYYTTDGNTPVVGNGDTTLYNGPIAVSATETVEAIAVDGAYTSTEGTAAYTISALSTPTVGLTAVSSTSGSATPVTITASGNDEGSVVTFGVTGAADGSFSPATCVITSGSCSVSYVPSGTLGVGTYTNDLTASFAPTGSYTTATATSTLTIAAAPSYAFSTLYPFTGGNDGGYPAGSLAQSTDGNFYGMSSFDGADSNGTLFKVDSSGNFGVVYPFNGSSDGGYPDGSLVRSADGSFYGMTNVGGADANGTVFKVDGSGNFTLLYTFTGGDDGGYPFGSLVQGTDGSFYGMTTYGGADGGGTVFKVDGSGNFTLLHTFTGGDDGGNPYGSLVQATDGSFYGTASGGGANSNGTVFKIDASGNFALVYTFSGGSDGGTPYGSLVQGTDGSFYGTTFGGGADGDGTVFKVDAGGNFTALYTFTGGSDGAGPEGSLVQGTDGSFYGTANSGGANAAGTLFKVDASGNFTLLYTFTDGSDGSTPDGSLLQGADGSFYGTATAGGDSSQGTIFKIVPSLALAGPVALTVPGSVAAGAGFTLSYAVANATSETMQQCFATNTGGDTTGWTGATTAATTATNVALTAPATSGTYTYTLTCGGIETGFATLNVP